MLQEFLSLMQTAKRSYLVKALFNLKCCHFPFDNKPLINFCKIEGFTILSALKDARRQHTQPIIDMPHLRGSSLFSIAAYFSCDHLNVACIPSIFVLEHAHQRGPITSEKCIPYLRQI